jgi:hypothetical protein
MHALNSFNGNTAIIPVIVKTLAPPEAIICKIEYPEPFTEEEKEQFGGHVIEFHDEQEYIVDSERLNDVEIVERYDP